MDSKQPFKNVGVRMPEDLYKKARLKAFTSGSNLQKLICDAVAAFLAKGKAV